MLGIDALFFWVKPVCVWFLEWLPWASRIPVHKAGVVIRGESVKIIPRGRRWSSLWLIPSWYWWVPMFAEVYIDDITTKSRDIPEQLLTTKDDYRVRAGGLLVYHITNIETWIVKNEGPEGGILAQAGKVLRNWVKSRKFQDVQAYDPDKRSDDQLTSMAQKVLGQRFGVRIEELSLTSFAETDSQALHHTGSIPVATQEDEE